jgi:hypothetical protein
MPETTQNIKLHIKAGKTYDFSFVTAFDPLKTKRDAPRLELYRPNKYDMQVLTVPINWLQKGTDRELAFELWYGRYQTLDPVDDIVISAVSFGSTNDLGKEIIDNGYFSVKKASDANYTPLTPTSTYSCGYTEPHTKHDILFKLNVPVGATTTGLAFLGVRFEARMPTLYGERVYRESLFQSRELARSELIVVKVHLQD